MSYKILGNVLCPLPGRVHQGRHSVLVLNLRNEKVVGDYRGGYRILLRGEEFGREAPAKFPPPKPLRGDRSSKGGGTGSQRKTKIE